MPAFKIKVKWGKEVFSDVEVSFLFKDDNLRVSENFLLNDATFFVVNSSCSRMTIFEYILRISC